MFRNLNFWGNKKVITLMYHQIGQSTFDPWGLAVSPINFEAHLKVLHNHFTVITSDSLANSIGQSFPKNAVCISFDDGYSDNFSIAKGMLEKFKLPATFFISSYYIEHQIPFWWDELESVIFDNNLMSADMKIYQNWRWPANPPDAVSDKYINEWARLKPLAYPEIRDRIDILSQNNQSNNGSCNKLPMSTNDLIELSKSPLFTIGAHTMTHPALSNHHINYQENEIVSNIHWIEAHTGKSVTAFSYPYGDFNDDSLTIVKNNDLKLAFTTKGKSIKYNDDPYQLGRFQVQNWTGEQFEQQLRLWFKKY